MKWYFRTRRQKPPQKTINKASVPEVLSQSSLPKKVISIRLKTKLDNYGIKTKNATENECSCDLAGKAEAHSQKDTLTHTKEPSKAS
jgi:hypothetical protein